MSQFELKMLWERYGLDVEKKCNWLKDSNPVFDTLNVGWILNNGVS
jgi:hypothetical protein